MKISRNTIKLRLQRPLSPKDIWNQIMDIQIQALESLIEEKDLKKWEIIFPCYGTSLSQAEGIAKEYLNFFKSLRGDLFDNDFHVLECALVRNMPPRWFNTIMSTLYMMEEDLMECNAESVHTLWDILFTCQALREEDNVVAMGLNTFKLK